jgi:hypothetical protein
MLDTDEFEILLSYVEMKKMNENIHMEISKFVNLTFMGTCIMIYFYSKTK